MRWLLLLLTLAGPAATAQPRLGAGLRIAGPVTATFEDIGGREFSNDRSRHWMPGAALDLRIAGPVSVEIAAFYRRVGLDEAGGYSFAGFSNRERGYSWEFPLVGRLRLPLAPRALAPFAVAGPSVRWMRTHTDSNFTRTVTDPQTGGPLFIPDVAHTAAGQSSWGVTAGLGVEHAWGPVRFSVEGRYTHWRTGAECDQPTTRCEEAHQGALIVGVGF